MNMGDRIHYLRKDAGLTLQELGEKVGVGASTVRKWETGFIKTLRFDNVQRLAKALDTSVEDITGWPDNSVNTERLYTNGVTDQNSGGPHIEYTKEQEELLRIYGILNVKDRAKLMSFVWALEEGTAK